MIINDLVTLVVIISLLAIGAARLYWRLRIARLAARLVEDEALAIETRTAALTRLRRTTR